MRELRAQPSPCERRAGITRAGLTVLIVALAALALVIFLVGGGVLSERSRPTTLAEQEAAEAAVAREHNARVLFRRAMRAADRKSWQPAKKHLAHLKNTCSKTSFYATHRTAIAELEKKVEDRLRWKPPPSPSVPRTPGELHASLRATNPDYTGNGEFELRDGQFLSVFLAGCGIRDLSPLSGLALQRLDCSNNPITNLAPLAGMPLERLDCAHTQVTDVSPLKGMPLKELSLSGLAIADPSVLLELPLRKLVFSPSKVRGDFSRLRAHKTLTIIGEDKLENAKTPAEVFWIELGARSGEPRLVGTLEGHEKMVCSVALSADGKQIASSSQDNTIRLWDGTTGQCLHILAARFLPNRALAFTPDGKRLVSVSYDGTFAVWDVASGQRLKTIDTKKRGLRSVIISPNGGRVLTAGSYGTIKLWDAATLRCLKTFERRRGELKSVAFSPDGSRITAAGKELTLWDAATGQCLKTLTGHRKTLTGVAFSPDGKRIVAGGYAIHAWDVASGRLTMARPVKEGKTLCVAFSPDGKSFASGGKGGLLVIRDPATGEPRWTLPGHRGWVIDVAFSANGNRIVSGGGEGTVRVWAVGPPDPMEQRRIEASWGKYLAALMRDQFQQAPGEQLAGKMVKRVYFDLIETPFVDVVRFVAQLVPVNIVVDPQPIKPEHALVTLRLNGVRWNTALRWVCRSAGMTYIWRDGAVFVTRPERVRAALRQDQALARFQQPPTKQLAATMAKKISFDFVEIPLEDVTAFLSKLAAVEIVVEPEAAKDQAPTVTLRVFDMRLDRAVRWVCRVVGMVYVWRDGKIVMTTPALARKAIHRKE